METEATTARTLMVLTEYAEELEQKTKELRAIIHALAGRHGLSVEQPSVVRFPIRVRIPREPAAANRQPSAIYGLLANPLVMALNWAITVYALIMPSPIS